MQHARALTKFQPRSPVSPPGARALSQRNSGAAAAPLTSPFSSSRKRACGGGGGRAGEQAAIACTLVRHRQGRAGGAQPRGAGDGTQGPRAAAAQRSRHSIPQQAQRSERPLPHAPGTAPAQTAGSAAGCPAPGRRTAGHNWMVGTAAAGPVSPAGRRRPRSGWLQVGPPCTRPPPSSCSCPPAGARMARHPLGCRGRRPPPGPGRRSGRAGRRGRGSWRLPEGGVE